jgi:hypothetical protein
MLVVTFRRNLEGLIKGNFMNGYIRIFIIGISSLFAFLSCTHTNTKDNPVPELKGFEAPVQNYDGATVYEHTWIQPCEKSGKTSEKSSLTIYGDNLIMNTVKFKTSKSCEGEIAYQTASIYKYATAEANLLNVGSGDVEWITVAELDLRLIKAGAAFYTDASVKQANKYKMLGFKKWKKDQLKIKKFKNSPVFSLVGIVDEKLCLGDDKQGWDNGSSQMKRHQDLKHNTDCYLKHSKKK